MPGIQPLEPHPLTADTAPHLVPSTATVLPRCPCKVWSQANLAADPPNSKGWWCKWKGCGYGRKYSHHDRWFSGRISQRCGQIQDLSLDELTNQPARARCCRVCPQIHPLHGRFRRHLLLGPSRRSSERIWSEPRQDPATCANLLNLATASTDVGTSNGKYGWKLVNHDA